MFEEPQGKPCPWCGEPMSDIGSQFMRLCTNGHCKVTQSWHLNKGQPPLVTSSKDRSLPEVN